MSDTDSCAGSEDVVIKEINILLLGEKSSGKSTFINSFGNYLRCPSLDNAVKSDLIFLIPTEFTTTNENFTECVVRLSEDADDKINVSTLESKAYVFPIKGEDLNITLIDTPGIGDGKNPEQDLSNFDNILNYISQFKHLNAICFFLNPSISGLSDYFKFCFTNLLSRLDETASRKVVFIINKSRSSFYKPEGSIAVLKPFLKSIEDDLPIDCSKKNIFCTDNEGFRYLAALKNGHSFGEMEEGVFKESWRVSVEAIKNLLEFARGHKETDSISVMKYRRFSTKLLRPLSDIVEVIKFNLVALIRHKNLILNKSSKAEDTHDLLYIPDIRCNISDTLGQVVCLSNGCSNYHDVSNNVASNLKICQNGCTLNILSGNLIGSPELLNTDCFMGSIKCKICNCNNSSHVYNLYNMEMYEEKLTEQQSCDTDGPLKVIFDFISKITQRQQKFEEELTEILKVLVKNFVYLQRSAIVECKDAFLQLLQHHVKCEKKYTKEDKEDLKVYDKILKLYKEELNKISEEDTIEPCDLLKSLIEIFQLEYTGSTFDVLYNKNEELTNAQFSASMKYCFDLSLFAEDGSDSESDLESNVNEDDSDLESNMYEGESEAGSLAFEDGASETSENMNLIDDASEWNEFEHVENSLDAFEMLTKPEECPGQAKLDKLDNDLKANLVHGNKVFGASRNNLTEDNNEIKLKEVNSKKGNQQKLNNLNKDVNKLNLNEANPKEGNQQQYNRQGNFRGRFQRGRGNYQHQRQNQQPNQQQFQQKRQFHQQNQQFHQQKQQFYQQNSQPFNQFQNQPPSLLQINRMQIPLVGSQEVLNNQIFLDALQKQSTPQHGVNLQTDRGHNRGRGYNRRGRGNHATDKRFSGADQQNRYPRRNQSGDRSGNTDDPQKKFKNNRGGRGRGGAFGRGRASSNSRLVHDDDNLKANIKKQQQVYQQKANSTTGINKVGENLENKAPKKKRPKRKKPQTQTASNEKVSNKSVVTCAIVRPPQFKKTAANNSNTKGNATGNNSKCENAVKPNTVNPSTGAIRKIPAGDQNVNRNQGTKKLVTKQQPSLDKMLSDIQSNVVKHVKKEMGLSSRGKPSFVFNIQNNHGKAKKDDKCVIS